MAAKVWNYVELFCEAILCKILFVAQSHSYTVKKLFISAHKIIGIQETITSFASMNTLKMLAAISGALAVILGAFGAHGLKPFLDSYQTDIYNKAVLYHFIHTLAILIALHSNNSLSTKSSIAFYVGILLFSGSLYLLATAHLTNIPKSILGPITPLGGLCFIAGWLLLAVGYYKAEN